MRRLWTDFAAPVVGCGLGLFAVFHPMIFSGFRLTHGGLGDARLVAYTLEHGFRWLIQMPGHESFWNPPIFYPYPGVSAFTEVLLGVGPFYWIWRILGWEPESSFQLWMLTVWVLNYGAAYFLLRKGFFIRPIAAACGALVFAFGTSMQAHFGHPQLAPLFYVALAFTAVLRLFRQPPAVQVGENRRWWIAVFFACVALQAYTCYYTFFFFGMLLALAGLWALAFPAARKSLRQTAREDRWALLLGALCCALALGYLASHYLVTAKNLGVRIFDVQRAPSWASWLLVHGRNSLYGGFNRLLRAQDWPLGRGRNGTGLMTLGLSLWAFYQHRRDTAVRLLLLACATMIVLATSWGGASLWKYVHAIVPGAAALRNLARIGMILTVPAALGVGLGVQALLERRRRAVAAVVMALCFAELWHGHIWIDKYRVRERVDHLAQLVDPDTEAFFMVCTGSGSDPHLAEIAEWVALTARVPTVNGRYGNFPPDWDLHDAQDYAVGTDDQRRENQMALQRWCERTGVDYDRVQWIEYEKVVLPRVRYRLFKQVQAGRKNRKSSGSIP